MYGIGCSGTKVCNGGYSSNWLWLENEFNGYNYNPLTWFGFSFSTQNQLCSPSVPPPQTYVRYLSDVKHGHLYPNGFSPTRNHGR